MERDFYVTLPSNVKSPTIYSNMISNYTTKLPQRIILEGRWEVGLVEISYTLSWYNIKKKSEVGIGVFDAKGNLDIKNGYFIPAGRYDTLDEIITIIDNILKQYFIEMDLKDYELPKIKFDKNSRKITIKHGRNKKFIIYVFFEKYLCDKLGINYKKLKEAMVTRSNIYTIFPDMLVKNPSDEERIMISEKPIELNAGCRSLFVYSNIVKPSIVGDIFTPILRLVQVPTDASFGDQIVIPYADVHYKPVAINEFDIIEVDIKDDSNDNIPFEFGRVIIKLHFRKSLYKDD